MTNYTHTEESVNEAPVEQSSEASVKQVNETTFGKIQLDEGTAQTKEVIDVWFKGTPESIDTFIEELHTNYDHDYGTVVYAMAAVALQAARKFNNGDQGGITGFQAGCVMWEFVKRFMHLKGPLKLVQYENMLYPQYFNKFDQTISEDTWKWLKVEAMQKLIDSGNHEHTHPDVVAHWKSIVDGVVPFGYVVAQESE